MSHLRQTGLLFPLTIFFGFIGSGLVVLQSFVLSKTINQVFLEGKNLLAVSALLRIILIIVFVRVFFAILNETYASWVARKVKSLLRGQIMAKIDRLGPAYLRTQRSGELVTTSMQGLDALDAYFSQYLPQVILAALLPLTILVVVFPLDILTGMVFMVTAPLIPFFMALVGRSSEAQTKKQWTALSRLGADFLDTLQGLTTLKILGRSRERARHIERISDQYRAATMSVLRITFLSALVLELLATLSTAVVAVEIGLRLLYGRILFEQAFFILLIAPEFYLPMRNLGMRYHAGMTGVTAAARIFELLDTPEQEQIQVVTAKTGPANFTEPFTLEFQNVEFTYPGRLEHSLSAINLKLQSGMTYALIGKSGAGKSTLLQMVMRYLQPDAGRILFNGFDIRAWAIEDWRRNISWVQQKPMLFNTSLLENVRLNDLEISEQAVKVALEQAQLQPLVSHLPKGIHTPLLEWGSRLSGGEAQRVALARAFLKNAPLVLMDEPTAHLDPELEASLANVTQTLMQNRTVITIAHRFSTIEQADKVIVLDAGKIVRYGPPYETIEQASIYQKWLNPERREA